MNNKVYLQILKGDDVETIEIQQNDWAVISEHVGIGGMFLDEMLYEMIAAYCKKLLQVSETLVM